MNPKLVQRLEELEPREARTGRVIVFAVRGGKEDEDEAALRAQMAEAGQPVRHHDFVIALCAKRSSPDGSPLPESARSIGSWGNGSTQEPA